MNRIILIGNGFDLAHNLKTSYRDFIDDFWVDIANRIANYEGTSYIDGTVVIEASGIKITHPRHVSLHDFHQIKTANAFFNVLKNRGGISIQFRNDFLGLISRLFAAEKWVDIEAEYYNQLKEIALNTPSIKTEKTIKLNQDFTEVEVLLCKYLQKELSQNTHKLSSIHNICDKDLGVNVKELSIKYNRELKKTLQVSLEQEKYYSKKETFELIGSTNILWASAEHQDISYFEDFDCKTFDWDKIVDDFKIT